MLLGKKLSIRSYQNADLNSTSWNGGTNMAGKGAAEGLKTGRLKKTCMLQMLVPNVSMHCGGQQL